MLQKLLMYFVKNRTVEDYGKNARSKSRLRLLYSTTLFMLSTAQKTQ